MDLSTILGNTLIDGEHWHVKITFHTKEPTLMSHAAVSLKKTKTRMHISAFVFCARAPVQQKSPFQRQTFFSARRIFHNKWLFRADTNFIFHRV